MSQPQRNEYLDLIDLTRNLINQIKTARIQLRRKSKINRRYIEKILSTEKVLDELLEHLKDIMDGVE